MKEKNGSRLRRAATVSMATIIASSTLAMGAVGMFASLPTKAFAEETIKNKAEQVPYRNVMYYGDWSIWGGQDNFYPKNFDASLYTHLNYAFIAMDANGELILTDKDAAFGAPVGNADVGWDNALSGLIPAFTAIKSKNKNLKIGISLGGWSKSANFSLIAANPEKRKNYINNILKFIKYTGMDFVDVDWEYPNSQREPDKVDNKNDDGTPHAGPADKQNFITLMRELRAGLDKQGSELSKRYELTCALPGTPAQLEQGIDVEELFKIIDFGNMMTYDMNGAWSEKSSHQTALYANPKAPNNYSVETVINYLQSKNVPSNKIVIGAAMYSRGWNTVEKGNNPEQPGLFQDAAITNKDADLTPSRGANNELPLANGDGGRAGGVWSYRKIDELKKKVPDLKEYWDDAAKAPYLYSESTKQFFTFDNVKSIQYKTAFVKEKQLGGVISWMASQDKDGTGSGKRNELSSAIKQGLYGDQKIPEVVTLDKSQLKIDVKTNVVKTDSGKDGYGISIANQESLLSGNVALGAASKFYFTVKKPTFVITMKDGSTLEKGDYKSGEVTEKDGKTYVNIATQYDGRYIAPGASAEFKLATKGGAEVNISNIKKIELLQYFDNDTLLASQTIFGDDTPGVSVPTISGVQDVTIKLGDTFDPKAGVKAVDKTDGDLTNKITIAGSVDTNKVGTYPLTYSVKNSSNQENVATRKVFVVESESKPSTPQNVNIANVTKDSATISWDASQSASGIKEYQLKISGGGQTIDFVTSKTNQLVTGLRANTAYTIEVTAVSVLGQVSDIAKGSFNTQKEEASGSQEWSATKVYNGGEIVTYKGAQYKAKWWTQGNVPDDAASTESGSNPWQKL
ncbi:glycosyl hydrolase family 18 protein [Enterococcus rivorum]|nr:glycosyl hydrolase family 18 protein [Enterococcus rivorum]MBP2097743.1 chitinase [Enterococcus rivorum]